MDLIREYAEVRYLLDKMARRANKILYPGKCGGCEGCRRDLGEVMDEAADLLRVPEHKRCTATFRHPLAVQEGLKEFSCVRRAHEDPWHTAGGPGGCWIDGA